MFASLTYNNKMKNEKMISRLHIWYSKRNLIRVIKYVGQYCNMNNICLGLSFEKAPMLSINYHSYFLDH